MSRIACRRQDLPTYLTYVTYLTSSTYVTRST